MIHTSLTKRIRTIKEERLKMFGMIVANFLIALLLQVETKEILNRQNRNSWIICNPPQISNNSKDLIVEIFPPIQIKI